MRAGCGRAGDFAGDSVLLVEPQYVEISYSKKSIVLYFDIQSTGVQTDNYIYLNKQLVDKVGYSGKQYVLTDAQLKALDTFLVIPVPAVFRTTNYDPSCGISRNIFEDVRIDKAEPRSDRMDSSGNIYRWDEGLNSWVKIGIIATIPTVTETQDGVVDPITYSRLLQLKQLGDIFKKNKIFVGDGVPNPYFYYFYSSDGIVKFTPQTLLNGNKLLRIEINRARLAQKLTSIPCIGSVGATGDKGNKGLNGIAAANERWQQPTNVTNTTFRFSALVNTQIDQPVSVRLFKQERQIIEILIPINGTQATFTSVSDQYVIDSSSKASYNKHIVEGEVVLSKGTFDNRNWRFKARQRGPVGYSGKDGSPFIEIVQELITDTKLINDECVVTMRAAIDRDLMFSSTTLNKTISASSIKMLSSNIPSSSDPEKLNTLAVLTTTKRGKDAAFYAPSLAAKFEKLNMPQWTPIKACQSKRRYAMSNFDWFSNLSNDQSPSTPFGIILDEQPPEQCCKENFFSCNNIGDVCGCPISGNIVHNLDVDDQSSSVVTK